MEKAKKQVCGGIGMGGGAKVIVVPLGERFWACKVNFLVSGHWGHGKRI